MITLKENELNGKKIAYSSVTEFRVQSGKCGRSYATRYTITGNLVQAVLLFNGINVGPGYQKRIYCASMNKPVLAHVKGW